MIDRLKNLIGSRWFRIVVSGGLLYWIIQDASLSRIFSVIGTAIPMMLAVAVVMAALGYLISVARWRVLLAAQGTEARFGFLLKSYVIAAFFNNILPSTVGGDTLRVYDSWRAHGDKAGAVLVVLVDRLLGVSSLALFASVGFVGLGLQVGGRGIWSALLWTGIVSLPLAGVVLFVPRLRCRAVSFVRQLVCRFEPLAEIVEKIRIALSRFDENRGALGRAGGWSLLLQTNVVVYYFVLAWSVGIELSFLTFVFVVPVAILVTMIPITINGLGLREGIWAGLLGLHGIATEQAVALAWLVYGLILLQGLVGGVVYAFLRRRYDPKEAERELASTSVAAE